MINVHRGAVKTTSFNEKPGPTAQYFSGLKYGPPNGNERSSMTRNGLCLGQVQEVVSGFRRLVGRMRCRWRMKSLLKHDEELALVVGGEFVGHRTRC